ncbi:SDR family oxidoreductase [Nocardioides sp. WS12]|uniref:SDR family oxidoreductase n=1 Tax=Nocardioides sp. WS12 TaxID=2486272 RepID=UPI0015FA4374|nr:SDR family oxidoreductase [Nocardioides sp. WS12]
MAHTLKTRTDLTGKVVAITGGARGIGRSTAAAFVARGAKVVIGDVDLELVEKTAAELGAPVGAEIVGLPLDVTDRSSFAAFLDEAEVLFGPLDVLVNNAGIMPTGLYAEESDAMTDRMIDINVHGVLNGSKLAAQRFVARGEGHLVNVASLAGINPAPALATYCGTKHFVLGFTESLHRELAEHGVGVTAVLPGVVRTELSAGAKVPGWAEGLSTVDPEDIAETIVDVVGTGKMRAICPKALGRTIKVAALLPERGRLRFERMTRFDQAFTSADPAARAKYHARITGAGK